MTTYRFPPRLDLTERERDILARRGRGESHDSIARAYGVTRGRIVVIERKAREVLARAEGRGLGIVGRQTA